MILEVAIFDLYSLHKAVAVGVDRIELCQNYDAGGVTPSAGMLKMASAFLSDVPLFPIIRPRGGDFVYSSIEMECILHDIDYCRSLGFKGVVLGMLDKSNRVDKVQLSECISAAGDMEVTFHRAFDRSQNQFEALEIISESGCKRILTSGGQTNALDGASRIKEIIQHSNNRITIVVGGGVRSHNISTIVYNTGAQEYHSSCIKEIDQKNYVFNLVEWHEINQAMRVLS